MKPFDENETHAFVEIALSKRELELKLERANERFESVNLLRDVFFENGFT
jgi:hypothetical protein